MLGIRSSKVSRKIDLYDNLFRSIEEYLGETQEDLSLYNWIKEHVMDGKDFSCSGINLREYLTEHTKALLREVDGISRGKLPCELADEEDEWRHKYLTTSLSAPLTNQETFGRKKKKRWTYFRKAEREAQRAGR